MKKAGILFLILTLVFALHAQAQQWQATQLDMQTGLSDNCVNDVLMDSRNFLWVATNAGLDFYDGINIVRVAFPEASNSLQPVVFTLAEDPSGTLWAGTSDGLFRIGKDRLEMLRFHIPEQDDANIRQMCCTADGFLWIALNGYDLIKINTSSGEISSLPIKASAICGNGAVLYVITDDETLLSIVDGTPTPGSLSGEVNAAIRALDISRMSCAGAVLIFGEEKGSVYALNIQSGELSTVPFASRMRDAIVHSSGEIWIAARDGIHVLDGTLSQIRVERPFHDNSFRCLEEDRQGRVWAGTLFEGLAQLSADDVNYHHYGDAFAGGRFKARDFEETPDGRIWIATDTKGLLCLDKSQSAGHYSRQFFPGRNVTGLMAEGGNLWVGTIDNELPITLLDSETGRMTAFPGAGESAYAFCRDKHGRLWIGAKDGFIVGRDSADGSFEREIFIPCKQVCRIICTADGAVWVASISGQVYRYTANELATFKIPTSNILTDIAEDADGHVFATSEGGGLWKYSRELNSFQHVVTEGTRLLKISRRSDGNLLWITGAHGIHILNPDDGRKLPLISREVLEIDSFNYSSNYIASDGTLYAGTSDGFISFSTNRLSEAPSAETVPVITSFHILSSSETAEGERYIHPRSMNIGRNARSFEVNVSQLDYKRFPSGTIFWKIEGYNDWTPVSGGSFEVYDIPTGKWDLKVKSLALSGQESPETVMKLTVQPPLLLSPVAFIIYLLVFLLSIAGIARLSDRRAKAKAAAEHEREMLTSKMEFLSSIAHEIRTPLSLVQIPIEALIRKFSGSADGSVQENLDIMRRNSLKLTVLINELLDFRKLTDSTFQIHPEFLDIRTVLKDAHRRFHPMFLQEGKSLALTLPETPVYCETDVRSLGRIFDNLLSNSLKYSQSRSSIVLSVEGSDAHIIVENDGAILPEEEREKIFQPFYRYEDSSSANVEGTGLGLSTSRQFATLLGGSLSMDDDLKVNRFIFTIPLSVDESEPGAAALPVVETKDKSVMVVEDDKDMARVIGDILGENYNIIYASNGRQALQKIESGASPTLVVSDVIMPEMDGIGLTKALKGNLATSHIPVILLSAEVPDVFMQESLEGGADAYLEKPFSPKKLRSTVDNLIENRQRVYEFYISSLPSGGELPSGRVSAVEQKFLRSIQEYVSANLHRNITLDDIAEVVCMSPSSLYKKMKEYADISPMEYVMKMRLHKAVELLKDDSVSVQEVASAVGFNTHSFFSECFKREFGMTPRQWRVRNVAKSKNKK
ncbi:MAG: helix-turn-helix domain-containing protein [Bacteroidales bacterium]|nr:helix-turn-helix domain-containing protein [Bacteroidales bacterium]